MVIIYVMGMSLLLMDVLPFQPLGVDTSYCQDCISTYRTSICIFHKKIVAESSDDNPKCCNRVHHCSFGYNGNHI